MTAIVLTFNNKDSLEQAQLAAANRGLSCHSFPYGLGRRGHDSFYRRWLLKNLPSVLPCPSLMVVPLQLRPDEDSTQAPNIMCDLALSVSRPEEVAGYLICED